MYLKRRPDFYKIQLVRSLHHMHEYLYHSSWYNLRKKVSLFNSDFKNILFIIKKQISSYDEHKQPYQNSALVTLSFLNVRKAGKTIKL